MLFKISLWLLFRKSSNYKLKSLQQRSFNSVHMDDACKPITICRLICKYWTFWLDKVANSEVLEPANSTSTESLLSQQSLCWLGHVNRVHDCLTHKDILNGELVTGSCPPGIPYLCYKDTCKPGIKIADIHTRRQWLGAMTSGCWLFGEALE